jgi:hypothetical protein
MHIQYAFPCGDILGEWDDGAHRLPRSYLSGDTTWIRKGSREPNHTADEVGDDDQIQKIEGWEPLGRQPFDGTIVDIKDESRPPWPLIEEIEQVTAA